MKTNTVNLGPAPDSVKRPPVITLTTDFGLSDPFVGIMKGVIFSMCPAVRTIDLTHLIPPQDILAGCLALGDAYSYFPPQTIHVAVIDPTVGSDRPALWVRTDTAHFIAPDNGLLSFLEADQIVEIRRLENLDLQLEPKSHTFHGRDVFAPAAAHLASGADPELLGPSTEIMVRLLLPSPQAQESVIRGEILGFDHFGNAITNLREKHFPGPLTRIWVSEQTIPLSPTYATVPSGAATAVFGSGGRLEISVRNGNARVVLGLAKGDPVLIL